MASHLGQWLWEGLFHEEHGGFLPQWYILTRLEDIARISSTSFKSLQCICHSWVSHPWCPGKGWSEDKVWDFVLAFNQLGLWGSHLISVGQREHFCSGSCGREQIYIMYTESPWSKKVLQISERQRFISTWLARFCALVVYFGSLLWDKRTLALG